MTKALTAPSSRAAPAARVDLDGVAEGVAVRGFVPSAIYVDDAGTRRGGRFVHARTRFVFDYLRLESAAQAFVHVTTYPSSDGGEPHTQEHLLLGRGNKGRYLGNFDHTMLAEASAFTAQYRTAYLFHTVGGPGTFWPLLSTHLDALLRPDYTDLDIRREVRDWGVAKAPDGKLSLSEKGTVYNEMVNRTEDPNDIAWYSAMRMIYGDDHPLAANSGGSPEGIRGLTPEKIRRFHAAHYKIGNMGMIGSFPSSVSLDTALEEVGKTLDTLTPPGDDAQRFMREADLPPPRGAPAGTLRVVDYPYASTDHPSPMRFAWPANGKRTLAERWAADAFFQAFGDGAGSTLYTALIDQKTRELDVGATAVWCWASNDPGQPINVALDGVAASHGSEASLRAVRSVVTARLRAIAAMPDGSKELAAFQERYRARLVDSKRWLDKFLDTPPAFGARSTGDTWLVHLERNVNEQAGFVRSLTVTDAQKAAFAIADAKTNPWRDRIREWGLLEAPSGVVARASPALRKSLDDARTARGKEELARLVRAYGTTDEQEALRRRAAEIAQGDEEIARAEATVPMPPFPADPPMTSDDAITSKEVSVRGVPGLQSTFDTMKSATVGLALSLDGVPEDLFPYLAVLPSVMQDVGVLEGGKPIPYDEVRDRLRREVLGASASFDVRFSKKRAELVLDASGNDEAETRRALLWIRTFLLHPDWRVENLPRIRDVVNEQMKAHHSVMTAPEEHWFKTVTNAYWRQETPVLAHAGLFITRAHDAFRVSWMLAGGADVKGFGAFVRRLATAGKKGDRASLVRLTAALADVDKEPATLSADAAPLVMAARAFPEGARPLLRKLGRDLGEMLTDLPDASLGADWAAMCTQLADDAARSPAATLAAFEKLLGLVRHADRARLWSVGAAKHHAAIQGDVDALVAALDPAPSARAKVAAGTRVTDRARARGAKGSDPKVVALVDPNRANGSLSSTTPSASYDDPTDVALVDYLTANVFNGTGGHSFYKRIWGAGLAYSGYLSTSPYSGRAELYTDRCSDLAQLLQFTDGEVRHNKPDPRVADYAVATAFASRVGDTYESRARWAADDLVSGASPAQVRAFRSRLLALRSKPDLAKTLHERLVPVYAPLIPSLAPGAARPADALIFAIGAEPQIKALEAQLQAALGPSTVILRLAPRDFW